MKIHEPYMQRCIDLARLGSGSVAPNPMVGAVMVHAGRIIGEGYHEHYGQAHAEVNCIQSVNEADEGLISQSILYVCLEPCAHHGKTAPCADLIIRKKIPHVVVGCRDPYPEVNGKGIEKMRNAGIEVEIGVLEKECLDLNKRFFVSVLRGRPFIILKWAQTLNRQIANGDFSRIFISNEFTNRVVHRWRTEEQGILVGTNTAFYDNPSLTPRLWTGRSPVRMVLDLKLRLPTNLKIFDRNYPTIVFNYQREHEETNLRYYQINRQEPLIQELLQAMHRLKIQSVLVEGGTRLIQSFIDEGYWDEMRVLTNEALIAENGLAAPLIGQLSADAEEKYFSDTINYYRNT